MSVFIFAYGGENHCVRIGTIGSRPLVYAVYKYSAKEQLPNLPGQTYKSVTEEQYQWVLQHKDCDVSWVPGDFAGMAGNLECRTHRCFFQLFTNDPLIWFESLEDRQV